MGDGGRREVSDAMFAPNNRLSFDRPVDEAARAWWLARFYAPHALTPEGMADLITRSVAQEKLARYDFIDGVGQAFRLRVEGASRWPKPMSGASPMTDDRASEGLYPSHDCGRMASDPSMTIGREDTEMREVLKRMWTRSGGDIALFDVLLPLNGPYGRPPKKADD